MKRDHCPYNDESDTMDKKIREDEGTQKHQDDTKRKL